MAKIAEQYVVFKVSKLVKGNTEMEILGEDAVAALEQIVGDAVAQIDGSAVVELETSPE